MARLSNMHLKSVRSGKETDTRAADHSVTHTLLQGDVLGAASNGAHNPGQQMETSSCFSPNRNSYVLPVQHVIK